MKPQTTVALTPILRKLVPLCFVTGAAIEVFMVKTGFCAFIFPELKQTVSVQYRAEKQLGELTGGCCAVDEIVTLKEAERRQQRDEERQEYLAARARGQ